MFYWKIKLKIYNKCDFAELFILCVKRKIREYLNMIVIIL